MRPARARETDPARAASLGLASARRRWWAALLTALLLLCPAGARAGEPEVRDLVVTNSSRELLLFLRVADIFTPEMVGGIKSGLPVSLCFDIVVKLVREGWMDKEIYQGQVRHGLRYDTLKQEYRLQLPETGQKTETADFDQARARLAELNGVSVLPLARLLPDRQYVLKVRATLAQEAEPSFLHFLLPFGGGLDKVTTDWRETRFRF